MDRKLSRTLCFKVMFRPPFLFQLFLVLALSFASAPLWSAYVLVDGVLSDAKYAPELSAKEHFQTANSAMEAKEWEVAERHFRTVTLHFADTSYYADALFYSGVCQFFLGDFDLANQMISSYLTSHGTLTHFEKAFEFKYHIAEQFAGGAKKHLFNKSALPLLASAESDAHELYDEVIASLPTEELAARSLFGKAKLLRMQRKYREAVETLLTLARRFPKHPLSADSYFLIADIYLDEISAEPQNPDLISLAKVNRERFQKSFPGDARLAHFDQQMRNMEELYGDALLEIGRYYERKKKPKAAALYYRETISQYPHTAASQACDQRLSMLDDSAK